jgi:hypothetical protein
LIVVEPGKEDMPMTGPDLQAEQFTTLPLRQETITAVGGAVTQSAALNQSNMVSAGTTSSTTVTDVIEDNRRFFQAFR